jgi:hypothetical protein
MTHPVILVYELVYDNWSLEGDLARDKIDWWKYKVARPPVDQPIICVRKGMHRSKRHIGQRPRRWRYQDVFINPFVPEVEGNEDELDAIHEDLQIMQDEIEDILDSFVGVRLDDGNTTIDVGRSAPKSMYVKPPYRDYEVIVVVQKERSI